MPLLRLRASAIASVAISSTEATVAEARSERVRDGGGMGLRLDVG